MIHVGFGSSNLYAKFVGTAMLSMFDNHTSPHLPSITVHILHDSTFSTDNREKFIQLAEQYNQLVKFYNVEELCAEKLAEIRKSFPGIDQSHFTINTFFRILSFCILPEEIEKIIFLDADLIINLDINELWQVNIDDKILGAVSQKDLGQRTERKLICIDGLVKAVDYFNAGVLLINLNLLCKEKENIFNAIKFIGASPYSGLVDQHVLNYCFSSKSVKLPIKFNLMLKFNKKLHETIIDQKIYHYAQHVLKLNQDDIFNRLWMSYFIRSPWFNEDAMGRLYEGFLKVRNDLQTRIGKMSAIMSGKTRAFFVEPSKIESMKEFFLIRDDEEIIPAENEDSIQKLIDAMKISQGKCVFFIMTPKFLKKKFPFKSLIKRGFVLDKDFVKGWEILSDAYGNPFDSYPLIEAM